MTNIGSGSLHSRSQLSSSTGNKLKHELLYLTILRFANTILPLIGLPRVLEYSSTTRVVLLLE